MILERLKSKVVAHLSYFVASHTSAFVVDPQRDVQPYIDLAKRHEVNIKHIFETHRNEDYVIGSVELAEASGASIHHGAWPDFMYGETLKDGESFTVGHLEVTAIHTPGHTPGCYSFSVVDALTGKQPAMVFTGDTLFIGDTGRTDFGGPENRHEWSENLYDSIHNKLLTLGDSVIIHPAHGSGSICGVKIAKRQESTLGSERLMNSQLALSREEFIKYKVEEHHEYIPYFRLMEKLNLEGPTPYGLGKIPKALTPGQFEDMVNKGAVVVDTRAPPSFSNGHIEDSYSVNEGNIGFAGWTIPYDRSILLVLGKPSKLGEIVTNLARIGYDNVYGYLKGTIASWYQAAKPVVSLDTIVAKDLNEVYGDPEWVVLDVRSVDEYARRHVPGAVNNYFGTLQTNLDKVPKDKKLAVYCTAGVRSSMACSILLRNGYTKVHNVLGGFPSWLALGYETES
jgi:hydroxyacylglutathione hydrolase